MAYIENSFSRLNRKLRYGVIYVVTAANYLNQSDIVSSQWISSRLLSMLRSLTGFDIEVVESPEAERTTLVARRINVGNAGTDSVVRMPLNYDSVSDVIRFVKSATDVLSTDKGDQILEPEENVETRRSRGIEEEYGDNYESFSDAPDKSKGTITYTFAAR